MTNRIELENKVKASGYRTDFICEKLGITYQAWLNKLKNVSEFKQSEIAKLSEILDLTHDEINTIFFTEEYDSESNLEVAANEEQ